MLFTSQVAARLREYKLHSLMIVGGFEAYHALLQLYEARGKYPEFCIPMVVVPATISNNVPGSDFSLGCDTALNEITEVSKYSAMQLTLIITDPNTADFGYKTVD